MNSYNFEFPIEEAGSSNGNQSFGFEDLQENMEDEKKIMESYNSILSQKNEYYTHLDERESMFYNEPLLYANGSFTESNLLSFVNNKHNKDNMYFH